MNNLLSYALNIIKGKKAKKQQYSDCVILDSFGRILLMQRSYQDDFQAGKWCLAGGKIEEGEDPYAAAIRELEEETGIKNILLQYINTIDKEECTINYFIGVLDTVHPMILDNDEHYRYQFVDLDDIGEYDLLLDLADVINEQLMPSIKAAVDSMGDKVITDVTPEEKDALIRKAFDKDLLSEADFVKYLQVSSALAVIQKGYDDNQVEDDAYFDAIEKSKRYEFVRVNRGGKTFFQYRLVGTDQVDENMEVGDHFEDSKTGLKVTQYSDKAYLISGNTFQNLDLLRSIKTEVGIGSWNKTLGGWVFPSNAKDKIMSMLAEKMDVSTYEGTVEKENAIAIKNSLDIGTEVTVGGEEGNITEVGAEAGKPVYTVDTKEPEGDKPKHDDSLPIGSISPDGKYIKTADGWEYIKEKKVTEDEIGVKPAIEAKADDIINDVDESSRIKSEKELAGKEEGVKSEANDIEQKAASPVSFEKKEFITRSGEAVEALDCTGIQPMDIQLVDQDGILNKPKPNWCLQINEPVFWGRKDDSFLFDYVKLNDDQILLALNGFEKKVFNRDISNHEIHNKDLKQALSDEKYDYATLKNSNPWGNAADGYHIRLGGENYSYASQKEWQEDREALFNNVNAKYAVVSFEQLVAMQDYYTKKRKALINKKKEDDTASAIEKLRAWDEKKESFYKPFDWTRLSDKQKKKFGSKEAWEALPRDQKVDEVANMKHPAIQLGTATRIKQVDDNHMLNSNFDIYKNFVDKNYQTPKDKGSRIYTHDDPCVVEYAEIREAIQWKKVDMGIQKEDNEGSYDKGLQTSYGDTALNDTLKESHGVNVKLQNGKEIKSDQIEQIKEHLDKVYESFGNRSEMSKKFGLKISHSGEKLMFARKALGLYIPSMNAIGVSDNKEHGKFGFTLAHEFAHFMDNYVGKKNGRHYQSDDYNSTAGKIASTFRKNMNKKSESNYINRTCECFARALEQYHAMKHNGEDAIKHKMNGVPYHQEDEHVNKDRFNSEIKPLIEKFLAENDNVLKSFFDTINHDTHDVELTVIEKAVSKGSDPSHGGKLVKVTKLDSTGKKATKWVLPADAKDDDTGKGKKEDKGKDPEELSHKELVELAKKTSEEDLKSTIASSDHEMLRKIAHDELDRRNGEENTAEIKKKEEKEKESSEKKDDKEPEDDGASKPEKIHPHDTFKGKLTLLKNTKKAPNMGAKYGQDVEPSGFFCIQKETDHLDEHPDYKTFTMDFKNPLIIDVTEDVIAWKKEMSDKYKAKGKALTKKLQAEGYDAIITTDKHGYTGEIIVFDSSKLKEVDMKGKKAGA